MAAFLAPGPFPIVQEFVVEFVLALSLLDGLGILNRVLSFQKLLVALAAFGAESLPQVLCVVSAAQMAIGFVRFAVNTSQSYPQIARYNITESRRNNNH